nr:type II CAAX endopeptidase family protein [uncultured Mucilaginibacter sp.]
MKAYITKHPVTCFVVIAFALSLLIGLPLKWLVLNDLFIHSEMWLNYYSKVLVVFGPAISAIIITYITLGRTGLKALLSKLKPHPDHIIWWLGLPFAGLIITTMAFVIGGFSFGQLVAMATAVSPMVLIMHLVGSLLFIGLGEELGWRGWLLPKLARGRTLKHATLLVFVIWALWHLPIFFNGYRVAVPFTILVFSVSIIFTWLWNRVGGNIFVLVVAHASVDFAEPFFEARIGSGHTSEVLNAWAAMSVIYLLIALVLYFADKKTWGTTLLPDDERLIGTVSETEE